MIVSDLISGSNALSQPRISVLEDTCEKIAKSEFDKPIYMDCASTTHIDPRVLNKLIELLSDTALGNSHTKHHSYGRKANHTIRTAKNQIASFLGIACDELTFTSGATESNNLVLAGIAEHLLARGKTNIISSEIEHKSVLEPLLNLKNRGFKITLLKPQKCGMVEASAVKRALEPETGLVSIQTVNNETGTIQPLEEIKEVLEGRSILFHTDSAQALGKCSIDLSIVDFASFSAHKAYAPQGIGALYVKAGREKYLNPQILGGNQQNGLRSGTLPVALCAAFGYACSIINEDRNKLQMLRQTLLKKIEFLEPVIHGHHDPNWNVPGILNLRFPGIDSETLMMMLPMVALSSGSACSSTKSTTSHVIESITNSKQAANEALRLSFGRYTSAEEIEFVAAQLIQAVLEIRKMQEE